MLSAAPAALAGNRAQPCLRGRSPCTTPALPAHCCPSCGLLVRISPPCCWGALAGGLHPGEGGYGRRWGALEEREDGWRSRNCSLWERMGRTGSV